MAGPLTSSLDEHLEWQDRLKRQEASGLTVTEFCLREGVCRTKFYRWTKALKGEVSKSSEGEGERPQSGEAAFVPITLKASPVEIVLPNGSIVRLPLGVGQAVLMDVIQAVGAPPGPQRVSPD